MGNPDWKPGISGNPGGRPRMTAEERERWKALATKCLDKLEVLADQETLPPGILIKITEISAARTWGQPTQAMEVSDGEGQPIKLVEIILGKANASTDNTGGGDTSRTGQV